MTLNEKEKSLLKDLRSQEQLCIQKYGKYAADACDGQLKNMFAQIGQQENHHLQLLEQIDSGTVPQVGGESQPGSPNVQPSSCPQQQKDQDAYLCSDCLSTEKHVSAAYDTCIFEFASPDIRNVLNHIQKEEQQHGENLYTYLAANNMYC